MLQFLSVYNNLCACLLQQPDSSAERVKELAEVGMVAKIIFIHNPVQVVIELDKNNEKAWYRHGQGCVRLKDFETARESFAKVAELSGGKNKDVGKWLRQCDQELEMRRSKEKKMYQEMFQSKNAQET